MTDLVLFLLLSAIAIVLLALPFLRRRATPDRDGFDLAVYRDQLAELERDLERGVIDTEAARAARIEIERRILAVAGEALPETSPQTPTQGQPSAWWAAGLVVVVPLAAGLLYIERGQPELRDLPLAARSVPEQNFSERDTLLANIEQLEQHLATTPDNGAIWGVLGRNRLQAGLYQEAAEAFQKASDLSDDNPTARSELAEAMVYAAGGQVTPASLEHFRAALETAPNEPRARYYLGLALAQEGEADAAIEGWTQLLEISPSDAPWRPQIVEAIQNVLQSEGRPADDVAASLTQGTAPGQATAASGGQDEMIRGMVEGLAARLENEPDDIEGWLMLGRSRLVLDEPELAKQAFDRARELAPERPDVLLGYAASLLEASETPGGDPIVSEQAVTIYEKLVTITPDDPEPHWLLGVAAAQAGNKDGAIGHWRDLLGLIEDGSDDKKIVEARITALESNEPAASLAAGIPSLAPTATSGSTAANGSATKSTAGGATTATAADDAGASNGSDPSNARPGPGQIRAMVEGLAARLEDDPSDIEGWLRLAQSRTVLGEHDAAKEAYRRAMEAAPEDIDVMRAYASSLLGAPHPETDAATVSADAAGLYRKIIELQPDDPEAHWYLGLAAVQEGTIDNAKTHWKRVLDVLGPDHPNYAAVQSSLAEVETKTQ